MQDRREPSEVLVVGDGSTDATASSVSLDELAVRRRIDSRRLAHPFGGARMLRTMRKRAGRPVGRRRGSTLMKRMGIHTLYRTPNTRTRYPAHPVDPDQLRHLTLTHSHHVGAADLTDLPMPRGFVSLFAAIDWASRRVQSGRRSHTVPP